MKGFTCLLLSLFVATSFSSAGAADQERNGAQSSTSTEQATDQATAGGGKPGADGKTDADSGASDEEPDCDD